MQSFNAFKSSCYFPIYFRITNMLPKANQKKLLIYLNKNENLKRKMKNVLSIQADLKFEVTYTVQKLHFLL